MPNLKHAFEFETIVKTQWGDAEIVALKKQAGHVFYWVDDGNRSHWVHEEALLKLNAPNKSAQRPAGNASQAKPPDVEQDALDHLQPGNRWR